MTEDEKKVIKEEQDIPETAEKSAKSATDNTSSPSDQTKEAKPEKKEESAADLLGANIEQVKIRKAKGSKNITSGIC